MDISGLIPIPDPIQVPWGWFYFFLTLTFIIHLVFMNIMLGSGIIALVNSIKDAQKTPPLAKDISLKLPYAIALTINFGVAPFLFLQVLYGHFIYVSSVLMAIYWLSVVGLLILLYYSAYIYDFKFDVLKGAKIFFIAITVILALIIAFLFTNNMTLMLVPARWATYFHNPSGTILNLTEPTLWPRYLHFVTASIAVGGLFVAFIWSRKKDHPQAKQNMNQGLQWFTYATIAQILIGFWFLLSLPQHIMLKFMGGSTLYTGIFFLALGSAILTLTFGFKRKILPAIVSTLLTITLMVLIRSFVRTSYLKPYFSMDALEVTLQYSPLIVFLIALSLGLGIIVYMLKIASQAKKEV
jgi:hypothetical protein